MTGQKSKMRSKSERPFLTVGTNNREDRMHFVRFWAQYVKTHSDEEWSRQQKILIDSQIQNARAMQKKRVPQRL